ncbi:hypothetical protein H310_11390 [Aphanomyces invadans]|uniref:HECT-type E3 ubiquitin transferase n=1 Tax=Aphanomyces invadans TaxID=157072 RepID=A0A024TLS4_9STRA|nr:hypothetical protein H310_11390 [Aphanomyces invadans]ETV95115.1 hypothetical protein H310_11390 [Aphanomyces invadans]|eukprot:XP_008876288.1 hypothetical protein H310_11390 [Aphanomyces invadans]
MADISSLVFVFVVFAVFTGVIYLFAHYTSRFNAASGLRDPLLRGNAFMPGIKREDVEKLYVDGGRFLEYIIIDSSRLLEAPRWECSVCEFYNFTTKLHCCLCGTLKGISTNGTDDSTPIVSHSRSTSMSQLQRTGSTLRRFTSQIVAAVFDHVVLPEDLTAVQRSARMRRQWSRSTTHATGHWVRNFVNSPFASEAFVVQLNPPSSSVKLTSLAESPRAVSPLGSPFMTASAPASGFCGPAIAWVPVQDANLHMVTTTGSTLDPSVWATLTHLAKLPFSLKYGWFLDQASALVTPYDTLHVHFKVNRPRLVVEALENLSASKSMHLAHGLLSPAAGLFVLSNRDDQSYGINADSAAACTDVDHLTAFHAVGRFVGRALLEGQMLPLHLSPVLFKAMLGVPMSLDDIEQLDPVVYKSLMFVLTHDTVDDLALTFSATECVGYGRVLEVDLVDEGRRIPVTEDNKALYVQRMVRYLLFDRVEGQLGAMLKGLHQVVPPEMLAVFDYKEFELILCGLSDIDVNDWKASTVSSSNLKAHAVLVWFWEIVESLSTSDQSKLLQYATGSSRVPVQGFKGLTSYDGKICYFTLKGIEYTPGRYPVVHACYNRIDLPLYPTKALLQEALTMVLLSDPTGFTIE